MKKKFNTRQVLIPFLSEILNRSKYDGEKITYSIETAADGKATISFDQNIKGSYFHQRVLEAYNLKEERDKGLTIPILTKKQSESMTARAKIAKKYGRRNYIQGNF